MEDFADLSAADQQRWPELEDLTPLDLNMTRGETVYIPCDWLHTLQYDGPALGVSLVTYPSFFLGLSQSEMRRIQSSNCSHWHQMAHRASQSRLRTHADPEL